AIGGSPAGESLTGFKRNGELPRCEIDFPATPAFRLCPCVFQKRAVIAASTTATRMNEPEMRRRPALTTGPKQVGSPRPGFRIFLSATRIADPIAEVRGRRVDDAYRGRGLPRPRPVRTQPGADLARPVRLAGDHRS